MAQTTKESVDSKVLNAKQSVTIKLPKNYNKNSDLNYPIILVLDGDYLFDPVIGQTDFQTYFGIVPESIVIGINHGTNKFSDNFTTKDSTSGDELSKFVSEELLPFIDEKYNTNKYRVIVGHKESTKLLNSFLLKDQSPFQSYINISPEFTVDMKKQIVKKLQTLNTDVVYYMATTTNDIDSILTNVISTSKDLNKVENKHLKFYFDNFDRLSHHTMVMSAVARGFEKVFSNYKPIKDKQQVNGNVASYDPTLD